MPDSNPFRILRNLFMIAIGCAALLLPCSADITGEWHSDGNESRIAIAYDSETQTYHGTIVALSEPLEETTGKPRVDRNNPDPAKRSQPIVGLQLMHGFKKKSDTKYTQGKIYDPKNGKTYSGNITQTDANTLKLRGFIGVSLLGRSTTWTRARSSRS